MFNEIAPQWHDNEVGSAFVRLDSRRCFRGQRGLARPECAVCSRPLRIWPLRTHHPQDTKLLFTSFSIPPFVEGLPRRSVAALTKCISCHWLLPVPVQLLYALRCAARSTQENIRGVECSHAQVMTPFSTVYYVITIFEH